MNPLIKALLLALLNYLVYTYILIPVSTPTMEDIMEDGIVGAGEEEVAWQEEDIFWFIQVTDLHISRYVYPDLQEDLREFLTATIDLVRPGVLLVSGDLTDAKDHDGVGSFQQEMEWELYRNLLLESNVVNKTVYLDIRGNHDTFDVFDYKDKENMFLTHSKQGPVHKSSYVTTVDQGGKTISFMAIDASLNPGPKKVFNFLGQLTEPQLEQLTELKAEAEKSDYQIYFGHFPLSCIVPNTEAKAVVKGGKAYLSGHLHTLGGLAPRLYTIHRTGTPEYELGDWKENRMWRLLALDNGILSFSDQRHGQGWPVILVTNPKNSKMLAPQVSMMDDFGDSSKKEISQSFVVEAASLTSLEYSLKARLILMTDLSTFLQFSWILACVLCILPPIMARFAPEKLSQILTREMVLRLRLFCSNKFLFYLYISTGLYITFGPWHVGEILTGHLGFIFPWGTVVRGSVLPSFYPYIFSLVHLLLFHLPLLWSLLYKLELRVAEKEETRMALAISNIPVTLVLSMQACMLLLLYLFPSKLGIFKEIALLLAPVEIITILIGFSLNGVVSYNIRDNRRSGRRF